MSEQQVTFAIFQGSAELGNLQHNLEKMKKQMMEAKKAGAELVVFPELFTVGYSLSNARMMEASEEKDGRTFMELSKHAVDTDIAVLYGYPEVEETSEGSKVYYNSAQFIDKSGKSLANYRKTHLWIDHTNTEKVFTPGESVSDVFEYSGVKIGILICYDVEFGEAVRSLALQGAQVILVPTANLDEYEYDVEVISSALIRTRAYENGVYVAYVDLCGENFCGLSIFYDPKGKPLASAGKSAEGIFLASIKKENESSYHMRDRRPKLYGGLLC